MIGLLLIGIGTGGIKPCVSAFGGDQFSSDQVFKVCFIQSVMPTQGSMLICNSSCLMISYKFEKSIFLYINAKYNFKYMYYLQVLMSFIPDTRNIYLRADTKQN